MRKTDDKVRYERDSGETNACGTHLVAKVQQTHRESSQNNGEMEPRQECPLIGERDFRLDFYGECNALGRRPLQQGLRRHD